MKEREDKFRTHRIIQIDKWIRSGSYPSVEQMVDEYGVSKRTILRDIEFLRDRYGAPLFADRTRKGYYYTDPTFMIQNVLLTEGDLFTVSTIMPLMEQYKNTPLEKSFRNIMEKIAEMLPDQVLVDTGFLNKDVSFISDPLPEIDEKVFDGIFEGIKLHRVLNFQYRSVSSKDYKVKTFNPYHVLCQKGNWYVIGYDHDAEDHRVYALSRCKNIQSTKQMFKIPDDFDVSKIVDLSFGIWYNKEAETEYELLFDVQTSNYILEREWHKDQKLEQEKDGSVVLKFTSNQRQQVLSWVMSFGEKVTVLKPKALKDEVINAAQKMLEKYK